MDREIRIKNTNKNNQRRFKNAGGNFYGRFEIVTWGQVHGRYDY